MTIPLKKKVKMLHEFAGYLDQKGWCSKEGCECLIPLPFPLNSSMLADGASNKEEQKLLEEFDKVIEVYQQLKPMYPQLPFSACSSVLFSFSF